MIPAETEILDDTDLKEKFFKYILDFEYFSQRFLKIKTKSGEVKPLIFNPPQLKLWMIIKEKLDKNEPIKIIILKARQEGISTFIIAFIFWTLCVNFNLKAAVIGHLSDASTNLFNIFKFYYDNMPAQLQPVLKASNAKEMIFEKLGSKMRALTAESKEGVGRSDNFQILHVTEKAFYADAEAVMTALLQSLSDSGFYFDESTANGIGGRFYNDWILANKTDESWNGLTPVFFAWFDLPEYSTAFSNAAEKKQFAKSLTSEEEELIKTYNLTYEQLNWRRYAIKFKCSGSVDTFHQEYPSCPEEAFLVSGRPVFDSNICFSQYKKYEYYKPVRFNLEYLYDENRKPKGVRRLDTDNGYFILLEEFEIDNLDHYRFAIGTDVAEGLEQGDYSSMDVLDRKQMKYVIKWHGHIEPDQLAQEQHKLQIYLRNKAYFCTEVNNHGLTTVVTARNLKVKQYYQSDFKKGYEVLTNQLGFRTTSLTKHLIINNLAEAIREKTFIDEDSDFWNECLTFVKNARGQMQAQNKDKDPGTKCFDDRVISKALSIECHIWMPNYFKEELKIGSYKNYERNNRIKTTADF